jgi:hypothetical protein
VSRGVAAAAPSGNIPAAPALPKELPIDIGAKQLYGYSAADAAPRNAGLKIRLVQQTPNGGTIDVDSATKTFHTGDRIRFAFESNVDASLYVVQQGSSGQWAVLFPNPQINGGRNAIQRAEEYQIPNTGWFAFDSNPGTEQVFVFLSREPLKQLPGFDRPITKPETLLSSVVEQLQHSVQSRDLVFETDTAAAAQGPGAVRATYVVNRTELGRAVAASITLTHDQ